MKAKKKTAEQRDHDEFNESRRRIRNILRKTDKKAFVEQCHKEINQASSRVQACMIFTLCCALRDVILRDVIPGR